MISRRMFGRLSAAVPFIAKGAAKRLSEEGVLAAMQTGASPQQMPVPPTVINSPFNRWESLKYVLQVPALREEYASVSASRQKIHNLDFDIANKCWSLAAKIHEQRLRNKKEILATVSTNGLDFEDRWLFDVWKRFLPDIRKMFQAETNANPSKGG